MVRLRYDPERDLQFGNILGCGSQVVHVADHELVHVMGFRHTATVFEDFQSGYGCLGSGRPDRVRIHAAIVYSRPPGNTDVDNDLVVYARPLDASRSALPVVACGASMFKGR